MSKFKKTEQGSTLIEVLIAIVVLSIGLLGLAGLQAMSIQSNHSAYYRSQATILAYNLADELRSNRTSALSISSDSGFPASSSSNNVSGTQLQKDKATWLNTLATTLPDGTGRLERTGTLFTISVQWNDNRGRIKKSDDTSSNSETFVYRTNL